MKRRKFNRYFKYISGQLRIADWFLVVFMVLVLIYLTHSLFFYQNRGQQNPTTDTIIRTTAAAIFGYFISGGFLQMSDTNSDDSQGADTGPLIEIDSMPPDSQKPKAQIGFVTGTESSSTKKGEIRTVTSKKCKKNCRVKQQTVIIGFIGLFSLVLLIVVPEFETIPSTAVATISQLRDFISGSVGLLIGHSTRNNN